MDTLRGDDFSQMNLLAKELSKMRKDDKLLKKQNTMRSQTQKAQSMSNPSDPQIPRPLTGN